MLEPEPEPDEGLGLALDEGDGAAETDGVPEVGPAVATAPTPPVVKPVKETYCTGGAQIWHTHILYSIATG